MAAMDRDAKDGGKRSLGLGLAALVMVAGPVWAQAGETGVSRPSTAPIVADPMVTTPGESGYVAPLKPRAGTPAVDGGMVSAGSHVMNESGQAPGQGVDPGDGIAVSDGGPVLLPRTGERKAVVDVDAGIVTQVPYRQGELPLGTMLKVRMNGALSTVTTKPGSKFAGELTEAVTREGKVLVPAGSVLEGVVTQVHGGKRISGGATLHLVGRSLTLPDGTRYGLRAQVVDTGMYETMRVNSEGTIYQRDDTKTNLAAMGLATGSGAVAGAVLGGGVGAVVGAGIGAGVSTVVWLKQDRQAGLPQDAVLVFSLTEPVMLNSARE